MKKRMYLLYVLFLAACTAVLTYGSSAVYAKTKKTYKFMGVKTKVSSFTKVRLSWPKKKNIKKVVIYGGPTDSLGNIRYKRKVKTLAGKKTSVTLKVKKKKHYGWRIEALGKISKGKQTIWAGEVYAYTDIASSLFDDYQYYEGKVSPKSISLRFYVDDGIKPDGAEIRRKPLSGGIFETVKTFTGFKGSYSYTDKTVKAGEGYLYSVRAWKKIGGKKKYGPADEVEMYAVNQSAKLSVSRDRHAGTDKEVIRVDSDADNGELSVEAADMKDMKWFDSDSRMLYSLSGISTDGKGWIKPDKKGDPVVIRAGGSIYLRFRTEQLSEEESQDYEEDYADYPTGLDSCCVEARYHGQGCTYLVISVPGKTGYTIQDSESIH